MQSRRARGCGRRLRLHDQRQEAQCALPRIAVAAAARILPCAWLHLSSGKVRVDSGFVAALTAPRCCRCCCPHPAMHVNLHITRGSAVSGVSCALSPAPLSLPLLASCHVCWPGFQTQNSFYSAPLHSPRSKVLNHFCTGPSEAPMPAFVAPSPVLMLALNSRVQVYPEVWHSQGGDRTHTCSCKMSTSASSSSSLPGSGSGRWSMSNSSSCSTYSCTPAPVRDWTGF